MKSLCNRRRGGPDESAGRFRRRKEAAPPAAGCRLWTQALLLAALLAAALFALAGCQETDPRAMREGSGHFERQDALPELSDEGVKCAITEAYYTNDGGLMLALKLSNGGDENLRVLTVDVSLENEEGEEIAVAATDQVDEAFYVPAGGYGDMSFYISPEYLAITDDDLDSLTYTIRITSEELGSTSSTPSAEG